MPALEAFHVAVKLIPSIQHEPSFKVQRIPALLFRLTLQPRKVLHGRRGIDAGSRMRDLFKYPLSLSLAMDLQLFRKVGSGFSLSTHSFLFGRALISDDLPLRCNIYPGDV